ncbi:MAG: hypothetical protein EOP83_11015, partial [Verrucomicrobiaceae bacterium]
MTEISLHGRGRSLSLMNTTRSALITTALAAVAFTAHAADTPEGMSWLPSDPLDLTLSGTHTHDLWLNLASVPNTSRTAPFIFGGVNYGNLPYSINGLANGGMFPGMTMWAPYKSQFFTGATQGELVKISNGTGGGPYPAGASIYYGGASPESNVNGGTLGLKGYAATGVKTVTAQISIGEAYGYSLFDTGVVGIGPEDLPKLKVYDPSGNLLATLDATYSGVIKKAYNGSLEMPPGSGLDEDVYINTYGLQWNLSAIEGDIGWYQADWTGVQHAQLWSLRLDQTDAAQSGFVFDLTSNWTGLTDSNWNTAGNWSNGLIPTASTVVTIPDNKVVDINGTSVASSITFTAGGNNSSIEFNGAFTLTVTGAVTINAPTTNTRTKSINVGSGTLTCASVSMTASSVNSRVSSITVSTGTLDVNGNIVLSGSTVRSSVSITGAGRLRTTGNVTGAGNLTLSNTSTVELD